MDTTVKQIMRKKFPHLKKTDSLSKAIGIFIKNPDMVFPVLTGKRIVGEVNQHEMLKLAVPGKYMDEGRILGPQGIRDLLGHKGKKVSDIMVTHDIKVSENTRVIDAARIMLETEVRTLEVIDKDKKPLGFVSELDILKYLKKKLDKK
jgi:CBS-domain-containing membrane protein